MRLLDWIRDILIEIYYLPLNLFSRLFYFFRVKNKVVFNNFNGRGFGENPQYIAQEIINQELPYELVWLVSDTNTSMPLSIRKVKFDTIKAAYELATARVIVSNVKNALPYVKKKDQYYIQTWHGKLPFKYIEGECEEKLEKRYVRESKKDSQKIDLILSGCSLDTEIFQKHFWYSGEVLEKGLPKYDMLFNTDEEHVFSIKKALGIEKNNKVVLYAPTFRDNNRYDAYDLNINALVDCLEKKTGFKWLIIIRMHPNVNESANSYNYNDSIINGSIISNPQELVLASDLLITDYSSIMVDFMMLEKPVFLYTSDFEEYKRERGLRTIYNELPFERANTNEELIKTINDIDFELYRKKEIKFMKERVCSFDDGHAAENVVERIKSIIERN